MSFAFKKIKRLLALLGPGFITGAADDDPSGIVTYSVTGALFGFKQLWTAFFSFPFMYAMQEMSGRIALVTGKGLAKVIKSNYKPYIVYVAVIILFIANTFNISSDLGAMAASLQLIFGLPYYAWLIIVTVLTLALEIFVSYKVYAKYLKYLAFTLLLYVFAAFFIKINIKETIYNSFVPQIVFSKVYLLNIVAILGTTISPYLFFWQSSEEVEEKISQNKPLRLDQESVKVSKQDLNNLRVDTGIGMLFSNLIMWFIILTTANALFVHGIHDIGTAQDAALALKPIAGRFASLFFTIGIVSTGLLAIPVLAGSAAYALSDAFNIKSGLYKKLREAHGFYGIITIGVLLGLIINVFNVDPIKMLYYTAILTGISAPPIMFIILSVANNKNIMGKYINSSRANIFGYTIAIVMSLCAIALLIF